MLTAITRMQQAETLEQIYKYCQEYKIEKAVRLAVLFIERKYGNHNWQEIDNFLYALDLNQVHRDVARAVLYETEGVSDKLTMRNACLEAARSTFGHQYFRDF